MKMQTISLLLFSFLSSLRLSADVGRECLQKSFPVNEPLPKTVKLWGTFSNVRGNSEHAYGRSVTLLEESGKCFGFINVKSGALEGGTSLLTQATCDKSPGTAEFETENIFFPSNEEVGPQAYPSNFSGRVKAGRLIGVFDYSPNEKVVLTRERKPDLNAAWDQYASLKNTVKCVEERLSKFDKSIIVFLQLPTNEYSRTFNDKLAELLCANADLFMKSKEKLVIEKLALFKSRLKENKKASTCLNEE